jgi:hypothetical protein
MDETQKLALESGQKPTPQIRENAGRLAALKGRIDERLRGTNIVDQTARQFGATRQDLLGQISEHEKTRDLYRRQVDEAQAYQEATKRQGGGVEPPFVRGLQNVYKGITVGGAQGLRQQQILQEEATIKDLKDKLSGPVVEPGRNIRQQEMAVSRFSEIMMLINKGGIPQDQQAKLSQEIEQKILPNIPQRLIEQNPKVLDQLFSGGGLQLDKFTQPLGIMKSELGKGNLSEGVGTIQALGDVLGKISKEARKMSKDDAILRIGEVFRGKQLSDAALSARDSIIKSIAESGDTYQKTFREANVAFVKTMGPRGEYATAMQASRTAATPGQEIAGSPFLKSMT